MCVQDIKKKVFGKCCRGRNLTNHHFYLGSLDRILWGLFIFKSAIRIIWGCCGEEFGSFQNVSVVGTGNGLGGSVPQSLLVPSVKAYCRQLKPFSQVLDYEN